MLTLTTMPSRRSRLKVQAIVKPITSKICSLAVISTETTTSCTGDAVLHFLDHPFFLYLYPFFANDETPQNKTNDNLDERDLLCACFIEESPDSIDFFDESSRPGIVLA